MTNLQRIYMLLYVLTFCLLTWLDIPILNLVANIMSMPFLILGYPILMYMSGVYGESGYIMVSAVALSMIIQISIAIRFVNFARKRAKQKAASAS